ncbi:MAG: zf-HC2 domain-containing protein [Planctomycetota bacterium]
MNCQDYKDLMMAYLDEELDAEQQKMLEQHLASCDKCSAELNEFKELKQLTDNVKLVEPEDRIWNQYWGNIYNRMERGAGWILFSISAVILLIYAGFKAIEAVVEDAGVETWLKVALLALIAGLAILLVSIARERLYFFKKDRYKDVRR